MGSKDKLLAILLVGALGLTGCSTKWDVDIERENTKRVQYHESTQRSQVSARVRGVGTIIESFKCSDPESPDCGYAKGMLSMRGFEALESITTRGYQGPEGETGIGVQKEVAKKADVISAITGGVITTSVASENSGDKTSTGGGSYTREESHNTTLGEGASGVNNYKPKDDHSVPYEPSEE